MPDKVSFNTKVSKRNKNPIYEEKFEYENIELTTKMDSRYLLISLYQVTSGGSKEDCLGATILKLNYASLESNQIFLREIKASLKSSEVFVF
jgi:Ca2+-dependent lipid-binding protein